MDLGKVPQNIQAYDELSEERVLAIFFHVHSPIRVPEVAAGEAGRGGGAGVVWGEADGHMQGAGLAVQLQEDKSVPAAMTCTVQCNSCK